MPQRLTNFLFSCSHWFKVSRLYQPLGEGVTATVCVKEIITIINNSHFLANYLKSDYLKSLQ